MQIKVDEELSGKLQLLADKHGVSVEFLANRAIRKYLTIYKMFTTSERMKPKIYMEMKKE